MRLLAIVAATTIAIAGLSAAPASAARPGWDHGHGRPGHHHGWHKRKVCRTVWHHHRRVRRCSWR
jgi:Spy/CpxP family protein refolding chaperone